MSSSSEIFSFTWSIKNFSMCAQKHNEFFRSPTFVVSALKNTEWYLKIYPKGERDEHFVACFLGKDSRSLATVTINFQMKILCKYVKTEGKKFTSETVCRTFDKRNWGFPELLRLDDLNQEKAIMQDDTLTIQCTMWKSEETTDFAAPAAKAVLWNLCAENGYANSSLSEKLYAVAGKELDYLHQYCPTMCVVHTRVEVERRSIIWNIKNFSSLDPKERRTVPSLTSLSASLSLLPTVYLREEFIQIEIQRIGRRNTKRNFVKCKVTLLDAEMASSESKESGHFFEPGSDDSWLFPPFLRAIKMLDGKNLCIKDDVLTLRFDFSTSRLGAEHHTEEATLFPSDCRVRRFCSSGGERNALELFYKDPKFCDVTLIAGGRRFCAHRCVLCDRSSVFNEMFGNDVREKAIDDVDPDTLGRMLEFMGTDTLVDLSPQSAVLLYAAADKYQIGDLKDGCASFLVSALSVSNVCQYLTLTDLHGDDALKAAVQYFILNHANECFRSAEWQDFVDSNGKLAAKIMHQVLKQKQVT